MNSCDSKIENSGLYYADLLSWDNHETIRFHAENAEEAKK